MADATQISIGGRFLECKHCMGGRFFHKTVTLDHLTFGMHFEGVLGRQSDIFVCVACGFVHFFMAVPGSEEFIVED